MPGYRSIFRLLDMVIDQTRMGNVKWETAEKPYEYRFRGTEAAITLTSIDRDGELPVRFSIFDKLGKIAGSWIVEFNGPSEESEFDTRVQLLWSLVISQEDPVASLIRDLENMPPF